MDNLILEKLSNANEEQTVFIKATGFNDNVCMSVRVQIPCKDILALGAECRTLLQSPLMHQWGEEEGAEDCLKLMVRGLPDGSAEGRLFMKAALHSDRCDTACFAIESTLGNFDAFGAALPSFLKGDAGTVLALCRDIRY